MGWEMWVRMEKIIATVLQKAHERQVEEATDALEEGPEASTKATWIDRAVTQDSTLRLAD